MRELIPRASAPSTSLGLGTLALAGAYGHVDEAEALAVVSRAIELGVALLDTADAYGAGAGEALVGRAIAGRADEVTVSTKVGLVDGGRGGVRNDRKYLCDAVGASRSRLGVERIDLLFLHRVDPNVPIEETIDVLANLVRDGVIAQIGLSEVTAAELDRALTVHPIAAVQSEWSVWSRDVEQQVVPACARAGVGFVASAPLGRGFLAGRTRAPQRGDGRSRVPRFSEDHRRVNAPIAAEIARRAHWEGMTPAQLSIAWLRQTAEAFGVDVVPIPGARSIAQLEENLRSFEGRASRETLQALDELERLVSGARGNPQWLSLGRE